MSISKALAHKINRKLNINIRSINLLFTGTIDNEKIGFINLIFLAITLQDFQEVPLLLL